MELRIRSEQVKTLYDSMFSLIAINLVVSGSLVFGYWDIIDHEILLAWFGAMVAMLMLRGGIYLSYRNRFRPEHLNRYSLFLVAGSAVAGIIWGAGGILLFPPDQLEYQVFILMALFGMTGGSTFTLSIYLPTYYAFSPIVLAPITIQLLLAGESIHLTMAAVTAVFLTALTLFNIKINRSFQDTMQLRFDNLDLIEELQKQKEEAELANSAKSKFLAAASHDLRQPLYALNLFAEVLDESISDESTRGTVLQIKSSVDALQNQFDTLLDISQLDAGTVVTDKKDFFLKDVVDHLAGTYSMQAEKKGIALRFLDYNYTVFSEPNLIEQILSNYLSNALRYTEIGEITLSCVHDNDGLKISVADTGKGIPAESLEDIFKEFEQLDNSERDRQKGFGLGLSIVQRAAKLLNHTIEVESEPGRGSVFSITIDRARPVSADEMIEVAPKEEGAGKRPLIVVVDDEASIREGITSLLDLWEYDTVSSADGDQAVEMLRQARRRPEAIISDFRLKNEETGLDVIRKIHAAFQSEIPALIVTGDIENKKLIALDASDYTVLHKPVPPAKLRAFLLSVSTAQQDEHL